MFSRADTGIVMIAASPCAGPQEMIWHVIYEDGDGRVQSRAARSRDLAIHMACELLQQSVEVRRVIGPGSTVIDRAELDAHYDDGHFPGLRRITQPSA
jgi:hypothetical protein